MSDENKSGELFPPVGDPEVGSKVFFILDQIIKDKVKLGLHKKWSRNYEMFKGKHWKKESSVPLSWVNLCFRHIQQTVNQLTDNNPTFNISKSGEGDQQVYDDLQRASTYWWTDQEQQDVLEGSVRNGEIYGICIEKVKFNPDREYGIGEVETEIVDPFYFGWYPTNLRDPKEIQQCDALFHYEPMSLRKARKKWPEADLKPDNDIINELEDERRNVNNEVGSKPKSMMTSLASAAKEILNWRTGEDGDDQEVLIVEAWVHDNTMVKRTEERVIEAVGDQPTLVALVQITEPKYPGGIRYIVAANGDKVLEDRGNPNISEDLPLEEAKKTYLFDKFPFSAANSIRDTSNAWGMSDIEQLRELNMEMNKAVSQLILEKDRAVRRKWVNPKTSGIPNEHFTNFHSILNPVDETAGAAIRVIDYPQAPVDIANSITLIKDLFFLISATFEVDQAQMGRDVLAYKSIAALIERVATMMRGKIRAYSRMIRERGRMYISMVQNFYTEDRWITFEDETGVQTTGKINGRQLIIPAKLTVVTGSTLPTSKVQQREEAINLFQLQAIDRQELLSAMEWSGRAEVIKRMAQGPIGAVMANFATMGMPPELVQFLQQVASLEPKELVKALKEGQIPPFQAIVKQMMNAEMQRRGQPQEQPALPPVDQADIAVKQADVRVKMATAEKIMKEAEKLMTEQALILAQIDTEKVDQDVKRQGVVFDAAKLKMDQARTVAEITKAANDVKTKEVAKPKAISSTGTKGTGAPTAVVTPNVTDKPAGYNESGMASNNQEV